MKFFIKLNRIFELVQIFGFDGNIKGENIK